MYRWIKKIWWMRWYQLMCLIVSIITSYWVIIFLLVYCNRCMWFDMKKCIWDGKILNVARTYKWYTCLPGLLYLVVCKQLSFIFVSVKTNYESRHWEWQPDPALEVDSANHCSHNYQHFQPTPPFTHKHTLQECADKEARPTSFTCLFLTSHKFPPFSTPHAVSVKTSLCSNLFSKYIFHILQSNDI